MARAKVQQAVTQTPEQQQLSKLISEGLTKGEGALSDIFGEFNEEEFNQGVKNPALKDFVENVLPQIQEKYTASGQIGGSAQRRGLNKAGLDIQSKLAELLYNAKQGQKQNRLAGVQTALNTQQFENIVTPPKAPKASIWESVLPAVGTAAGGFLGGPGGAALGNLATKAITG